MRRRTVLRTIRMKLPDAVFSAALLLALCFLLGGFAAMSYSEACDNSSKTALSEYLCDYCALYDQSGVSVSFWKCFHLYFGSTLLAFLFGFSSLGILVIPMISAVFGFTSFYTVSCFALAFGRSGVFAAAALISVRLFFTVPCFFVVASAAWRFSCRLSAIVFGRGKRIERVHYSSRYFLLFACCFVLLCIGVCCEQFITPTFFRAVIDRVGLFYLKGGTS